MVFSTNQVRQFYVVTDAHVNDDTIKNLRGTAKSSRVPGTTELKTFSQWGQHENPDTFEFLAVNVHGDLIHSDIIHRENIRKVTFTSADDLKMKLPTIEVERTYTPSTANTNDLDVYYMNFSFPGFLNATDEEVETKTVAFKVGTFTDWADAAVDAITKAFNVRQNIDNDLLEAVKVSANKIEIVAKEGGIWRRGLYNNKPNRIVVDNLTVEEFSDPTLSSLPLENNSRVKVYGTATDITATTSHTVVNTKLTADLEYFCMGERGDQYRGIHWPNVIHTDYMVDETDTNGYSYLDIHYYFQGEGTRDDKSEKVITLVAKKANESMLQEFQSEICGTSSNQTSGGNTGGNSGNNGGSTGGNGDTTGGDPGTSTGTGND